MDPKLQEYIDNAKREELIRRGLYEKKYYDPKEVTGEMRKRLKYDIIANRFVEFIPYKVTDEEYQEIIKVPNMRNKTSGMAIVFYVLGALIFFLCIANGNIFFQSSRDATVTLPAFFSGMLFIGIGKIIDLLEKILNK